MLHDPLLSRHNANNPEKDSVVTTPQDTGSTPKSKRRPPARSAKILTIGLSTTAMLGMTTGYAFADLAKSDGTPQPSMVPDNTFAVSGANTTKTSTRAMPMTPTVESPQVKAVQTPPAVANNIPQQEVVIEVPTPQMSGATPGNGNSSWNNQKSSGSN